MTPTVRALVDHTDGTRAVADIPVHRTTRLWCGCTRYEGTRPGPTPGRLPAGVHILSGCATHPDERSRS